MIARLLRIHGRVQGVYFRESMRQQAECLGVDGWVRNRMDGSVEAWLQGSSDAVEALQDWAWHGPPGARVDRIDVSLAEPEAGMPDFSRRPTA